MNSTSFSLFTDYKQSLLYVIFFLWLFCFKYEKCPNFCNSLKKKLKLFLLKNLIFLDSNAVEWRRWLSVIMENVLNSWQCFFQPDNETAFKVKVFSDWRQIKHCKTLQKNQSRATDFFQIQLLNSQAACLKPRAQHSTLIW